LSNNLFRIHHYIGSPEVFFARPGDARRTREKFDKHNRFSKTAPESHDALGWLKSFVAHVGAERAFQLTQGLREWAFADAAHARLLRCCVQ